MLWLDEKLGCGIAGIHGAPTVVVERASKKHGRATRRLTGGAFIHDVSPPTAHAEHGAFPLVAPRMQMEAPEAASRPERRPAAVSPTHRSLRSGLMMAGLDP